MIVVLTFDALEFSVDKFRLSSNFNVVPVFSEAVNLLRWFFFILKILENRAILLLSNNYTRSEVIENLFVLFHTELRK